MAKRTVKKVAAQHALSIVEQVTGETLRPEEPKPSKNAAAVALGRMGGLKGGKARADKLTPEERSTIARKAASQRWTNKP
jgi:hypothetical protein